MAESDSSFERLLALFRYRGLEHMPTFPAGTRTVEALLAAGQRVARDLEQLARRQAEMIQTSTRALMGSAPSLARPEQFQDASQATLQTLTSAAETTMSHLGELAELLVKFNAEVVSAMNSSMLGGLSDFAAQAAEAAPVATAPAEVVAPKRAAKAKSSGRRPAAKARPARKSARSRRKS